MATNLAHFNDGIVSMDRGIRLRMAKGLSVGFGVRRR